MRDFHPAWERMYLSVLFLAKGRSSLRDRLRGIYQDQLLPLSERDFPVDEQKGGFSAIMSQLERLETLSDDDCSDLAEKVVSLYNDTIESQYED